ncbi:MAG: hypothetical protein R3F46_13090 [bacterium]
MPAPTFSSKQVRGSLRLLLLICAILLCMPRRSPAAYETADALAALPYVEVPEGHIRISAGPDFLKLFNGCVAMEWRITDGRLHSPTVDDLAGAGHLQFGSELFRLELADGNSISSDEFRLEKQPQSRTLVAGDSSPRLAGRLGGMQVEALLRHAGSGTSARYLASLMDGGHYIHQELEITSSTSLDVKQLHWLNGDAADFSRGGAVEGSPAFCGNFFLGIEHPLADNLAGVPSPPVADWQPQQMSWPEFVDREWVLGNAVQHDGPCRIRFQYTSGAHRLEVTSVRLIQDGRLLAADEHFGASGIVDVDNEYGLEVSGYDPLGSAVRLVANIRSDQGTDSHGTIFFSDLSADAVLRCSQPVGLTLEPGRPLALRAVCGVAPAGQMRRAFNRYLELERAHPYRQFLHYNSWYDIGYFSRYSEQDCLNVVNAYCRELHAGRGVKLDSFLFDDGWDDYDSLWDFHDGFPQGFRRVGKAAQACGAGTGVWLSPWGGYGEPRQQRITASAGQGYEINEGGFALSGPNYYRRFREICLKMIRENHANQFKLDGLGRTTSAPANSAFNSDFDAAIGLIGELREARSDLFVNLTTGTWPSPFWLEMVDSIYRGGYDHEFTGEGSPRQQWITYRDGQTYRNIARDNPLYPVSSLMLHGIIYAKHARDLDTDPGEDLRSEIRSYFGSGTCLQELYISPELMNGGNWDDLAAAAVWARQHARELCDVQWIGGDPEQAEIYGWAGWSPEGAVLTLRNPWSAAQEIQLNALELFDLEGLKHEQSAGSLLLISPYADQRIQRLEFPGAEQEQVLQLEPFEVLVFSTHR